MRVPSSSTQTRSLGLSVLAAALLVAGCTAPAPEAAPPGRVQASPPASSQSASGPSSPAPVIQPGRPGEPATTVGPDVELEEPEWNHADMAFMQMMIPHHGQALAMSRLVPTRARDDRVRRLAGRVMAVQGPEIDYMSNWLREREQEVPAPDTDPTEVDHGAHGHQGMTGMQGMLTESEMAELRRTRGDRFDRLFLAGMIRHHRGAIAMAGEVAVEGSDPMTRQLAAEVSAGQSAEILRLEDVLRDLA